MRHARWAFLAALWIGAAAAIANPVMLDGTSGVQVPETFHAQVTYFVDSGYGSGIVPSGIERDGKALALVIHAGSVAENGGSGITSFDAYQACDCDLPLGTYTYKFHFDGSVPDYYSAGQTIAVTIVSPPPGQPAPAPEIAPDADILPWDIPDAPWPKGFDCAAWCVAHPGPTGPVAEGAEEPVPPVEVVQPEVGASLDTAAAADVTASPEPTGGAGDQKEPGTCAVGTVGSTGALALLLCGLLCLAVVRRRRPS